MQHTGSAHVSNIYGPYVGSYNVESFRYILYRCGILASGEGLLEKLTGQRVFRNPALELFVEKEHCSRLCEYLTKIGYGYEEDEQHSGSPRPWLEACISNHDVDFRWTFSKGELRIVVVVCPRAAYEGVISKGNSCLMVVATDRKVICPYPASTLVKKEVMIAGHGDEWPAEWRKKYCQVGWKIVKDWDEMEKTRLKEFQPGLRWLGDGLCKVWNLTPAVQWRKEDAYQVEANGWTLLDSDYDHGKLSFHYKVTKPWPNIKFRYVLPDRESATFAAMLFSGGTDLTDTDGYKDDEMKSLLTRRYAEDVH
ncbi:hypothetical protein BJ165DRAFT_1533907 [Panaeolus papilionaceus]|nr:hypothetical protein BJ165DRAFT_1533907 [Panaeolus papilionaceus]